jgi:hypothetical protein
MIPDTLISLKIAKKHVDTSEMKDRVVMEAINNLTVYLTSKSQ